MPSPLPTILLVSAPVLSSVLGPAGGIASRDLTALSLAELVELEVTAASGRPAPRSELPAALTVLTGEDLRRAGSTSLLEALRAVPGLRAAPLDARQWTISASGLDGPSAHRMLVLIDGRSVQATRISGLLWDLPDVPIEHVARVEIVRDSGAGPRGATAVTGIVNVVTRRASASCGDARPPAALPRAAWPPGRWTP